MATSSLHSRILLMLALICLITIASASIGDRLPEFQNCVIDCKDANCAAKNPTQIPLLHRLLLWDCRSECDYQCQHIVTNLRLSRHAPHEQAVQQFHGKWPFYRFLGMQEPFSVLFSLFNLLAHVWGQRQIREKIPSRYPLLPWMKAFGWSGYIAWTASMIFHTRDFNFTEKVDYFAAGGSVLFGLYYAPIFMFRLDDADGQNPWKGSVVRVWTGLCLLLYAAHVSYLSFWRWDYTYNMAANVAIGMIQNVMWFGYSYYWYSKTGKVWKAWPAMIVVTIMAAMSFELLEFIPWNYMIDAHSLWHLGTVAPTVWWYLFLIKTGKDDTQTTRLKA